MGFSPNIPGMNVKPIIITIEELKNDVVKDVYDSEGKKIGEFSLREFKFQLEHPKCGNTNSYSVNDVEFLPDDY